MISFHRLFWRIFIFTVTVISISCGASYRTYQASGKLDKLQTPTLLIEGVEVQYKDTLQYPSGYTPEGKPLGSVPVQTYNVICTHESDTVRLKACSISRVPGVNLRQPASRPITFRFRRIGTLRF